MTESADKTEGQRATLHNSAVAQRRERFPVVSSPGVAIEPPLPDAGSSHLNFLPLVFLKIFSVDQSGTTATSAGFLWSARSSSSSSPSCCLSPPTCIIKLPLKAPSVAKKSVSGEGRERKKVLKNKEEKECFTKRETNG